MPIDFLNGVTIDIEKIPDYHKIMNATFKEKLDKRICEIILYSDNPLITNEMKQEFKKNIVDNLDEKGILEHSYFQQNDVGRFLVESNTSVTSHQKESPYIAHTLYKYIEWVIFDVKTYGLSLICQVLKTFKKRLPVINLMCNDFDGFVDTIKKYYQKIGILDKRCIKRLIYNFIGSENFKFSDWVSYLKNKNIYIKNLKKKHPLIVSYEKEIRFVKKIIYENNSQLALYLQDKKTFDMFDTKNSEEIINKIDSLWLTWKEIIETEIIFNMYNFLKKEKVIKNNYCTIFGDGIIFPHVEFDKDAIIKKLNKYIKIKTGFTFHVDLKSLEEEEFIIEDIIDERNDDDEEDEEDEEDEDDEDDEDDDDEDDEDDDDDDEEDEDEEDEEDEDDEDDDDDDEEDEDDEDDDDDDEEDDDDDDEEDEEDEEDDDDDEA
jgi:hypothetical protein